MTIFFIFYFSREVGFFFSFSSPREVGKCGVVVCRHIYLHISSILRVGKEKGKSGFIEIFEAAAAVQPHCMLDSNCIQIPYVGMTRHKFSETRNNFPKKKNNNK